MDERITYRWKDIDVFGEKKSKSFVQKFTPEKVKSMLSKNYHHIPTRKHLLKSVFGVAKSGELLGILGASGTGKSE